jgi:hypothetical protein
MPEFTVTAIFYLPVVMKRSSIKSSMPPKSSVKKGEVADGEDPLILLSNYQKYSR